MRADLKPKAAADVSGMMAAMTWFDSRAAFDAVERMAPASRLRVCTADDRPDLWNRVVAPPRGTGPVDAALVVNPGALPDDPHDYRVLIVDSTLEQPAIDDLRARSQEILDREVVTGRPSSVLWEYDADDVRMIVFPRR